MNPEKGSMTLMKEINKNALRNALKTLQSATKAQLSELTGLTNMTVGTLLDELLYENEVFLDEMLPSSGGRPARGYKINADFSQAIIIYGHEKNGRDVIFIRVINLLGEILAAEEMSGEALKLESFEPIIERLILVYPNIKAIGFGFPGIEPKSGISINDYIGITGVRFTEYYKEKYGFIVLFENDTNAAVSGYCRRHPKNAVRTVCYLYFPTKYPPGSGIWINGDVHRGRNNFAGEISYIPLGIDWKNKEKNRQEDYLEHVALLMTTLSSTIAPDLLVLHGEGIDDSSLEVLKSHMEKSIPPPYVPSMCISSNFNLDYEEGMIELTLNKMEEGE
ncbi:MAG: ROK family protein [Clostridiaceae bacterium]